MLPVNSSVPKCFFVTPLSDVEAGIKSALEQLFSDGLILMLPLQVFSRRQLAVISYCRVKIEKFCYGCFCGLGYSYRVQQPLTPPIMPKMLTANMTDKSIRE